MQTPFYWCIDSSLCFCYRAKKMGKKTLLSSATEQADQRAITGGSTIRPLRPRRGSGGLNFSFHPVLRSSFVSTKWNKKRTRVMRRTCSVQGSKKVAFLQTIPTVPKHSLQRWCLCQSRGPDWYWWEVPISRTSSTRSSASRTVRWSYRDGNKSFTLPVRWLSAQDEFTRIR